MMRRAPAAGGGALDSLIDMVARDPDVVSCLHRIYNTVLLNDLVVEEGKKAVTPLLLRSVNREYKRFFKDAVVLVYMCGFVPYHFVDVQGTKYPRCLPLGSFTWRVRTDGPGATLADYDVTIIAGSVKQSQLRVFEVETPVLQSSSYDICSPLSGVLNEYLMWKQAEEQQHKTSEWNKCKHFAVTERIDVKDQSTSGIQLLDEQRRYNLTGQHNNVVHSNLMYLTGGHPTQCVNSAFRHAVHTQFEDAQSDLLGARVGSKRAAVHLMPPNTDVQELSNMDTGTALRDAKEGFQDAVYVFFGLPNINKQLKAAGTRGIPAIHQEQYCNILYMQTLLERLGETTYAQCFGIDPQLVCFSLRAMPRFEVTCVEDLKILWETQILTPADLARMRKTIMNV